MHILTERLELIPMTSDLAHAAVNDRDKLAADLHASVPDEWPPEIMRDVLEFFAEQLDWDPGLADGWWGWYTIHRVERVLMGSIGFSGRPDDCGVLVMGYSIIPAYEGQGYITEAAKALVDWAFSHPKVQQVAAETYPDNHRSIGVMENIGMTYLRNGDDHGTIRYAISRQNYKQRG